LKKEDLYMQSDLAYQYEDERPSEIIGGKVVMMAGASINHNRITGNIYRIFSAYLKGKPCEPLFFVEFKRYQRIYVGFV